MDQQEDQRRPNRQYRLVPRAQRNNQRRNMTVQRRNVVHYRVLNFSGPAAPYPQVLPSSQEFPPHIVYGPNEAGNQQVPYLAIPPISYIPPQATHIAIPLTHMPSAFSPTPQILLSGTPRFVHVGPRGALNGASSGMMRFPTPREEPIAPMRVSSPNAYVAASIGSFSTGPVSVNAPPSLATSSRLETVTYEYSNTTQRIVPPPVRMPNGARIVDVENMPPVEEVHAMSITEVVSSTDDEELN